MDENQVLILIEGKDKTSDIVSFDDTQTSINIRFRASDKLYTYRKNGKVKVYKNSKQIDPQSCQIYSHGKRLFGILRILDFGLHIKIFYVGGKISIYYHDELRIDKNILIEKNPKYIFEYLKELAREIKSDENDFLDRQYRGITHVSEKSVLAKYLKCETIKNYRSKGVYIFPFGLNLSQEKGVTNGLTHQISIIKGPPGTGKTQTILNIIANLIMENKTVAIVSNNNAAIQNVYDKLKSHRLDYFAALVGNRANQENFFTNQKENYPDIFLSIPQAAGEIYETLASQLREIKVLLNEKNLLAQSLQELESLKVEKKYFHKSLGWKINKLGKYNSIFANNDSKNILSLWMEIELLSAHSKKISLFFVVKVFFKYGIFIFSIRHNPFDEIILALQKTFYGTKERELDEIIHQHKEHLKDVNFDKLLKNYENDSMKLLKLHLSKKYNLGNGRKQFVKDDLWRDFQSFIDEYPVVLSTTHSLRSFTHNEYLYDYLIVDEASQVDIVAGGLAMTCAKNIIIVGDLQQLPHIVSQQLSTVSRELLSRYQISPSYDYHYSLLESTSKLFANAPVTMLKEHYRCHPKIIDFCNKKFYNNELIILSQNDDSNPLVLVRTAEGNHARGKSNQRQIDVIKNEILPSIKGHDIGIISPFREQVAKLSMTLTDETQIEIDTVHKYQGREKETIIITTVVNGENNFADDPNLLNVAISRAKKKLYVVVSSSEENKNMQDLVNYIQYHNFEITDSKIYSIFDLLYQNYAPFLNKYLHNLSVVSQFKSENLMNFVITRVLSRNEYLNITSVMHYPLSRLVRDMSILGDNEKRFVYSSSHVDFLLYNKISKKAILAIEVDGYAFHEGQTSQLRRDSIKNQILEKCAIPLIRFATNGSDEEGKLVNKLREILV